MGDYSNKVKQLEIINKYNPMHDDIHVGIRKVEDILTFDEAVYESYKDKVEYGDYSPYPDITNEMVEEALKTRKTMIYSSYEIKQGTFVTMSKMQAKDYSGSGRIHSKYINVNEVAWISIDEGMYANINYIKENKMINESFSKKIDCDYIETLEFLYTKGEYDEDYDEYDEDIYDVVAYDYEGNMLVNEELFESELEDVFDERIVNLILQREKQNGEKYRFDDLIDKTLPEYYNDKDIKALCYRIFNIIDEPYKGGRGYILRDGSILDFGTYEDHNAICAIHGMTVGKFVSLGNIRFSDVSIELEAEPTYEQEKTLKMLLRVNDNDFYVDICKYDGDGQYSDVISSAGYSSYNKNYLIHEIDRYFSEGIRLMGGREMYESKIMENFNIEVNPKDVNLSSFKLKNGLNKDIWNDEKSLNPKVRLRLLEIADDFYHSLGIRFVKPSDIILTGSICNKNWSEFSDIDLHLVVDFSKISDNKELVNDYFLAKKNEWNELHKRLTIYGFKVELYVQDVGDEIESSGVYTLEKNKWIKKPDLSEKFDLKNVSSYVKTLSSKIMTIIDDMISYFNGEKMDSFKLRKMNSDISLLFLKLKEMRQRGLENEGEYSKLNLVYKVIRRTDYFKKLFDLKNQIYDKMNSIKK